MLISREAHCDPSGRQGSPRVSLVELRRRLARPMSLDDAHRQRLGELASRLAGVRGLGDEYGRVGFSEHALAALNSSPAEV